MNLIKKMFGWKLKHFLSAILGIVIFSFAVNFFVTPSHLYSGGVLGLSQLIRSIILTTFNLEPNIDIAPAIYYIINIPLFYIAYKKIGKTFFFRTLLCVTIQTILMAIIPIPDKPIVDDTLTNVIIGGMLDGLGMGILLSAGASSGGTDIIGIALTQKYKNASVGRIGLAINGLIYIVSGIMYGLPIMVYSIVLSAIGNFTLDQTHKQNISSLAIIFTKEHPKKMIEYINNRLYRDATYTEATGGYTETTTYITYVALSKYELERLIRHLKEFDKQAFLIKQDGIGVTGDFNKHLDN